jgi:hypothetical protein
MALYGCRQAVPDMPDISMEAAFFLARHMGPPANPPWLHDIATCAHHAHDVDSNVLTQVPRLAYFDMLAMTSALNLLFLDWVRDPDKAPDCASLAERKNVLLRLWSGCLCTAKHIKHHTNDGPLSPSEREEVFVRTINPRCAECSIYGAGSLAAVQLMLVERPHKLEELCFEGVPEGSLVLTQRPRGT